MCREAIYELNLNYLNHRYTEYQKNHYEKPTLFEILEYGHQEVVHTKFFYWMLKPAYHQRYKDLYVKEFLRYLDIDIKENSRIQVHCERTSDLPIPEDESRRRSDLYIDIENDKNKKRIVIENKIFSNLTEFQVDNEVKQYFTNHNDDVFIAFLLDSHKQEFHSLIKNSELIKNHQQNGIEFKLFTYSDWLTLNKNSMNQKIFSRSEKQKVMHLNENIERLIKMSQIKEFKESFKTYLNTYEAIQHYEQKFRDESGRFLENLKEQILQNTKLTNGRKKQLNKGLKFDYGELEIEIDFSPENGLHENEGNILIHVPTDLDNREDVLRMIEGIDGYNPNIGTNKWKWIEFSVNSRDATACMNQYMKQLTEVLQQLND